MEQTAPNPDRSKRTKFHNAAVGALRGLFFDDEKSGDIELTDEYQLSMSPLRIDVFVKKNGDAETKSILGKIFRRYNVIEYKSPSEPQLALCDFDKTVHAYVGTYASQNRVTLTDMSATIICFKKPVNLFRWLVKNLNYEILQKYDGIYYLNLKGTPAEQALAIQIAVTTELPESEIALGALRPNIDKKTADAAWNFIDRNKDRWQALAGYWFDVFWENLETPPEEADMTKKKQEELMAFLDKFGALTRAEERGRQEGRLEGRQEIFALLDNGYSVEEVKKRLQPA
jgi:hypothetical protein